MRKRFKNMLWLITFLLSIIVIVSIFYFLYKNFIHDEADIKTSGPLSINYIDGSKIRVSKNRTINFSVINSSEESAFYYIEFKNLKNIKGKITYVLSNGDDIHITDTLNSYNTIVSSYLDIKGGEVENYTLTFEAEENIRFSLELNVSIENLETNNFAEVILQNNEINEYPLTVPGLEIATGDEGLIRSIDDYGTTYYFRGNVLNNNVLINDVRFKIVRINGDGTVRLVLDGQADTLKKYYETSDNYSYKDSIVLTYLENEWSEKVFARDKFYLSNQKYCNDMNIDETGFLALTRIKTDNIPSFVCLGDKITSKVGLLTVDEVIYAGATLNEENTSFYLYNSAITNNYYLMTSAAKTDYSYNPFMVTPNGKIITSDNGGNLRSVRPVVTIIKTATASGDGTVNNPYVLTND